MQNDARTGTRLWQDLGNIETALSALRRGRNATQARREGARKEEVMGYEVSNDQYMEAVTQEDFGEMLAYLCQQFKNCDDEFLEFMQAACDTALHHYAMPEDGAAPQLVEWIERIAIGLMRSTHS